MRGDVKKVLVVILGIIIVLGIGIGAGIGIWIFVSDPSETPYLWSVSDCPGAPSSITVDQIIKVGTMGDVGEIEGDANYKGVWFAAKEINEAGGVEVNGKTYYIGITSEDTDESNPNLVITRGIDAARRLINYKRVDFAIGGFRSEALLEYVDEFMAVKTIFLSTGASTDILTTNVIDDYETYKYFFRFLPINSTSLNYQIRDIIVDLIFTMNSTYLNHEIKQIGILAENLTWTESLIDELQTYIPAYTNTTTGGLWEAEVLTPIKYNINISAIDMNTTLATLQAQGADIVIPLISGSSGILMMQQYAANMYDYLIFGIDNQAQLDNYWSVSGGDCAYETIIQQIYRTNKTSTTIAFWDDYNTEFGREPLDIAAGAYDAVMGIVNAINATNSLLADDIIAEMETWTTGNPHPGVSGGGAWWPNSHDLVAGYPYGYSLWSQWQPDGSKIVIPTSIYPDWLATGVYIVAPWVHTAWTTNGDSFSWSASDAPGAPTNITADQIIKIGAIGDIGEIEGDANYNGAWFAAKEINEAGGIDVNGTTYYIGVTSEDTDETSYNLVISIGVNAARRLIFNKTVDFAIGGSRPEALLAYVEQFMEEEVIFIDTGAPTDIFSTNVIDDYTRYKYFFRFMPINSTTSATQIITALSSFILTMNTTYTTHEVRQIGILAEDLTWTASLVPALQTYLPPFTSGWAEMLTPILYDITLTASDMNAHLATFQAQGADIVIPLIAGSGGILMMQQYAFNEYDYLLLGIDNQAQLDTFWANSGNSAAYETIMQSVYRTNKTSTTIAFWDNYIAEFGHEPSDIAAGAYDAVIGIVDAINATNSLLADDIISEMETWTTGNPHPGVSGGGAWWPNSHDIVAGYPYGYKLWCQWQPDGTKTVVSGFGTYPEWLTTGTYTVPPWVHTTWIT